MPDEVLLGTCMGECMSPIDRNKGGFRMHASKLDDGSERGPVGWCAKGITDLSTAVL
jgi:hypothetical protein